MVLSFSMTCNISDPEMEDRSIETSSIVESIERDFSTRTREFYGWLIDVLASKMCEFSRSCKKITFPESTFVEWSTYICETTETDSPSQICGSEDSVEKQPALGSTDASAENTSSEICQGLSRRKISAQK